MTDEVVATSLHMAAAVFSLFGGTLLILKAVALGSPLVITSAAVYSATLFLLFLASTLHHGINASPATEKVLRILDYSSIFLLIAGTLTPVALVSLRGSTGWALFGVVWAVGAAGIALKASLPTLPKWITNTLYLVLGWLPILVLVPLARAMPLTGVLLTAAGGLCYSGGAVVFAMERPNPIPGRFGFHEIWHLAVMLGASCHFMTVYWFVLAPG